MVYHGPRESVLDFFEPLGFRCPERKGIADFLQEARAQHALLINPSPRRTPSSCMLAPAAAAPAERPASATPLQLHACTAACNTSKPQPLPQFCTRMLVTAVERTNYA
jgi:hypothetical protein